MTDTAPLQATALQLLCRPDSLDPQVVAGLPEAAWTQILDWGREHRFLPQLEHGLRATGLLSRLPPEVRDALAAVSRRSAFRALAVQGDMIATHQALQRAGIDHVFLKGASLALFAYPQPGLRPLRDIDVLVRKPLALDAFAALQAAGFVRPPYSPGEVEDHLDSAKHLPRLDAPQGGTAVELHVRLTGRGHDQSDRWRVHAEAVMERARTRAVADRPLRFPAAEDLLLHLCIHAVYEHQFDNGPLILSDLRWLLAGAAIDWPRVWEEAAEQGATRGVALVLALLEQEWPAVRGALPTGRERGPAVDAAVVAEAAGLLFRSFAARGDVVILKGLAARSSAMGKLLYVLGKAFPSPGELARQFPRSPGSPTVLTNYPLLWKKLLRDRLPELVSTMKDDRRQAEAQSLSRVSAWLADD